MFVRAFALALAAASLVTAQECSDASTCGPISGPFLPNGTGPGECTSEYRLAGAKQVIFGYNLVAPGASAAAFQRLPLADDCMTFINPNGGPAIPVGIDRPTTYNFAVASRQAFSRVTGQYTDFDNGTTIIHTNVTLGLLHTLAVPVTFYADVFLTYDPNECLIKKIQAFATIPTRIAGIPISPPVLDTLLAASDLHNGALLKKKRALIFEA